MEGHEGHPAGFDYDGTIANLGDARERLLEAARRDLAFPKIATRSPFPRLPR